MKEYLQKPYFTVAFLFAVLFIGAVLMRSVSAWTNPGAIPPNATAGITASGGNVGIGTAIPNYKLDVNGDINYTGILRQNGAAVSLGGSQWITSGSSIYYNSGNVGIGTTNPTSWAKLEVNGNVSLTGNDGSGHSLITSEAGGKPLMLKARGGNYPDLFVSTGGNVGIGTATPGQKLDVSGYVKGTGLCIGTDCRTSWPGATAGTPLYSCPNVDSVCNSTAAYSSECMGQLSTNATCQTTDPTSCIQTGVYSCTLIGHLTP